MSQEPTRFDDLMRKVTPEGDSFRVDVGPDWMQGRTLYGGITAALCLRAVRLAFPDLPALRSVLVAFAGPSAGDVSIRPRLLRRGKSAAFVTADLSSEAGFGVQASFCFGAVRPSAYSLQQLAMPDLPSPESVLLPRDRIRPSFTDHFDMGVAGGVPPMSGAAESDIYWWLRPRDSHPDFVELALLALADAPPPAALGLFKAFAPISTMTWMVDFLSDDLTSPGDWHAAYLKNEHTGDGYSAQNAYLWASDGRPLLASRQTIALFG
ncbi:hypothetical protein PbB2_02067 [Candidatus Phycosocius bacilliformis]|uniref:Acyl-CoA thioesterase 2 n=1 Tax=Candidatus Phycosocius bacilliformis TaxID=1445552 RepID=A0A2P2EBE2_9PROT|nr:thioesterase family protein [Candidatus Phycosocius bacilliformis]GBF58386.1 hypothetical protein PbB2_02067 [Candidatus Phycosocius bacilliformis]